MPVVFRHRGYNFFFYSDEETPREPPHIHVRVGTPDVKFWLRPEVHVAYNDGVKEHIVRELQRVVIAKREYIERFWNGYFD